MRDDRRWAMLLAAGWLGLLLTIAAIATPAGFALLPKAEAGRLAGYILAREAGCSVVLAAILIALQRARVRRAGAGAGAPQVDAQLLLPAGALFCTVVGYYALLPMMEAARQGQGPLSFAALHGVSTAFFAAKVLLVGVLAWRCTRTPNIGAGAVNPLRASSS